MYGTLATWIWQSYPLESADLVDILLMVESSQTFLWALDGANREVVQIDSSNMQLIHRVGVGASNSVLTSLALEPVNKIVWVADAGTSALHAIAPPYALKTYLPVVALAHERTPFLPRKRWLLLAAPPSILYLMLATLYFLAIPLGESPDEPGHIQCIQQVALYDRLPIVDPKPQGEWWKPGVTLSGRMCYHMPLYYVGAGLLQKVIGAATGSPLAVDFPEYNEAFGETGVMFLHPNKQRLLQSEEPAVVSGVRAVSVLLGLTVVWATMATSHLLFPQFPMIALVAGVWIAGWPQFLFLSRAINNDVLATALAAITLAVLLRWATGSLPGVGGAFSPGGADKSDDALCGRRSCSSLDIGICPIFATTSRTGARRNRYADCVDCDRDIGASDADNSSQFLVERPNI